MLIGLWLACSGDETGIRGPKPEPAEDTSDTADGVVDPTGDTGAPSVPVTCEPDALNSLRAWCALGEGAEVVFSAPGAPERRIVGEGRTLVWGLRPELDYAWVSGEWSGSITTGSLPAGLADLDMKVAGALPAGVDAVLFPGGCQGTYWTMVDSSGAVVWYELQVVTSNLFHGFEWSAPDQTILAINAGTFVETALDGTFVRTINNTQFTGTLHHDLARWKGYTYLLYEERVGSVDVDGVHVFYGDKLIASMRLDAFYTVTGSGPFGDWSHANGIEVDDQGKLTLSLLSFDSVLGIDGDPASSAFLLPSWIAAGQGGDPLPGVNFRPNVLPDDGFADPHNAARVGDDLWVFDNVGVGDGSRAARYRLFGSEMWLTGSWNVGATCPAQGGAMPVGGGVLVTCPITETVMWFDEASATPDWSIDPTCPSGLLPQRMTRAVPVSYPVVQ